MHAMLADLFPARVVRVAHIVKSVSYLSCVSRRACSNMANREEAVVLACTSLVFLCSGFASISSIGTTSGQSEMDVSTPVHVYAVATPLNTCRACRAVLPDKRDTYVL